MVEKPVDSILHLSAGTAVRVRPGDLVFIQVLRRLSGQKWAVGIKGRVVPAVTDLELMPGQRLRARVMIQQGRIVLRLQEGRSGRLEELLRRAGLPQDPDVRCIVEGLLRSGFGVRSERVLQVRRLLEKLRLDPRRFSRLAALSLEKGIDLQSGGLEELLPILGYGEGKGDYRRYRGRKLPEKRQELDQELQQEIKEAFGDVGGREQDSSLPVFNHLRGRGGAWVVIPFHFAYGSGSHLYGTLRLLYDDVQKTSKRLVLVVSKAQERGESTRWSFLLDPDPETKQGYRLSVFSSNPRIGPAARRQMRRLKLKLQNLGIETDDTIRIDDGFDGFSSPEDAPVYESIDVER